MEIYEILYTVSAGEVESGDFIRFTAFDGEGIPFDEQLRVKEVDYDGGGNVVINGYSEVSNDSETYELEDETNVEILGG